MTLLNQNIIHQNNYQGKTVLVIGAARAGIAATELLLALGANVILNDCKTLEQLRPLPNNFYQSPQCRIALGQVASDLIDQADILVISPGIPINASFVKSAQKTGKLVLGEMALAASLASQQLIAVSGTNGKTTTVSLLGKILRQAGKVVHVAGNIGFPLSKAILLAKPEDIIVCEVSSFQLETALDFRPQIAAMLNVTPDHLDRHGDFDNYVAVKKQLFANMCQGDIAVLNQDDPNVLGMANTEKLRTYWFSLYNPVKPGAWLENGNIMCWHDEQPFFVIKASELKIIGLHNVQNALAATAIANAMGVPIPVIAYALKQFEGVEHRIEYVKTIQGVKWLNDSKGTNPDSTIKALSSMEHPTILIAGGYDKQIPFDALAGEVVSGGRVHSAVLIGQTSTMIADSLKRAGFKRTFQVKTLKEAVGLAQKMARPGDCVLFSPACSSFDMFSDYEQRGRVFKQLVNSLPEEEGR